MNNDITALLFRIKENIKALLQTEEGGLAEQGIDSPTTD